jgi:signal transduction histidine kinase
VKNSSSKEESIIDLILQLNSKIADDKNLSSFSEKQYLDLINTVKNLNILLIKKNPVLEKIKFNMIQDISKPTKAIDPAIEKQLSDFHRIQHDIMSPVKSIRGAIEVGRMMSKDDIKQLFNIIEKCNASIEQQLNNLLEIVGGKVRDHSSAPIDFNLMTNDIIHELSHLKGFNETKFNITVNNKTNFISDSRLVSSVIRNLLSNAVKYGGKNTASIVDVNVSDSKDGVTIEVTDNGKGIDKESLELIFKPRFRTTNEGEGSGMGLHIVNEAVKTLGGTIKVNSKVGVGSSFTVALPLAS